jgi:serine phosphatase RsbU (regulator of sigma subunit)
VGAAVPDDVIMAPAAGHGRRRWPLRTASLIALLVALAAAAAATWGAYAVVDDQEQRLLNERASEVKLVLDNAISAIPTTLADLGGIAKATNGNRTTFERAAAATAGSDPSKPTFAWLRPAPGGDGYVVLAAAGGGLHRGDVVTGARAATMDQSMRDGMMVATPVIGPQRTLGFALGPPAAPAGTVLYRQVDLGPLHPPRAASSAPFAELEGAISAAPAVRPALALSSTTPDLPLRGDVRNLPLDAGASHWLLSVSAKRPLVGSVASNAWWVTLAIGLIGAALIALVIETVARRRDAALALYDSEHQIAETLQRSLLPRLPAIPGLELSARYLAGARGQQVGGDWFDAFPVQGGRVGIAVGDVIGHDLTAASAMAEIRAALRAYAIDGDPPRTVVNRIDHLVDALGLTQLVTVVYAVLEPPAADGSRMLAHTNAGHLSPLLRDASGQVRQLAPADSIVIGAPIDVEHVQSEQRLEPGSTLLLFTDGLVEEPGRSLGETLQELAATFAADPPDGDLEATCDRVLTATADRELRDDVALLAIRIADPTAPVPEPTADAMQEQS